MIKILVVEDEIMAQKRLCRLINEYFQSAKPDIFIAGSLQEANELVKNNKYDLLFLDLNLNGEDGFEVIKQFTVYSFQVIVISANYDRALEAFEYGVIDFVPKPVLKDRLFKGLDRFNHKESGEGEKLKYLTIKESGRIFTIPIIDIIYISANGHYSEIVTNKCGYLHNKSLENLLLLLPDQFTRIHKSYILNRDCLQHIKSYPGSKYEAVLNNGKTLPFGRVYYKRYRE